MPQVRMGEGVGRLTALTRAAEPWREIKITDLKQRQLKAVHNEFDRDFTARDAPL